MLTSVLFNNSFMQTKPKIRNKLLDLIQQPLLPTPRAQSVLVPNHNIKQILSNSIKSGMKQKNYMQIHDQQKQNVTIDSSPQQINQQYGRLFSMKLNLFD